MLRESAEYYMDPRRFASAGDAQGFEEFIPTRLDWLTFVLNSFFRSDNLEEDRFKFFYLPMRDGISIEIKVFHYHDVDIEYMMTQG